MASVAALYTPEVLSLAASLAAMPFDPAMAAVGTARSASCGSRIDISLTLDGAGRIQRVGLRAQACAIGQAAAAIFAAAAPGLGRADIAAALAALRSWLLGEGTMPAWPGLAPIAPAQAYPGRHGAILLAWIAALEALSTPEASR